MLLLNILETGLSVLIAFFFGSSIGSFLNVVIYRIPAGLSLLHPPSRCPKCLNQLKWYDNVPVFGWLHLRGRCRFCKTSISPRYPIIEAVTGLLFICTYLMFDWSPMTLGYWAFLSWLVALAMIDLDTLTLPNSLTQSGLVVGILFQGWLGWTVDPTISSVASHLLGAIAAAVLGIWLFDMITIGGSILFGQTAMGGGDAKLAAMMGAWLGWQLLLLSGFLACALGAVVGGGAIALGLLNRRQPIPFGPFLALAALISAFVGNTILSAYQAIFFPNISVLF